MPDIQIPEHEHYAEAIASVRKRVPVPKAVWNAMQADEREHAFTVSQVARTQVLQSVLDAIDKAVTTGTAITDFRDEVADKLIDQWGGEIPGRIETIFRTNIGHAYAEGRHAINSAPAVKEARPYWRYDDTDNDRECDVCHDCHGVVLPADNPWWQTHHSPLHHCCECEITALSPEEAADEGIDDAGPDVEADEGFGNEPSSEGKDWAPDLSNIDPELRAALEAKLAEIKGPDWDVSPDYPRKVEAPEDRPAAKPVFDMPPEPQPELNPSERIQSHIEAFEDKYIDRRSEKALIVDGRGEALLEKAGTARSVGFTAAELRLMKDAHVVHNHPSGQSLSPADLHVAIGADAQTMVAIGRDAVTGKFKNYSFNRPAGGWPQFETVMRIRAEATAAVMEKLYREVGEGRITSDEAAARHHDEVWKLVQHRVDVGYNSKERDGRKRGEGRKAR
jgi:hypothetical protein